MAKAIASASALATREEFPDCVCEHESVSEHPNGIHLRKKSIHLRVHTNTAAESGLNQPKA